MADSRGVVIITVALIGAAATIIAALIADRMAGRPHRLPCSR